LTFVSPLALFLLLAIPIIIIFYILRARYERIEVSSTLLWRNVIRDTEGKPTWRPPIRNILLLLQLLIAAVIAIAVARPAALGTAATHHVLILDASTSMQATDTVPTRFAEATRRVIEHIQAAPEGDSFSVLRAGATVELIESGQDRQQVIGGVSSLKPGVASSAVRSAMQIAGSLARERAGFRTIVTLFSDGAHEEQPGLEPGIEEFRHVAIGTATNNVAVVALQVRRIFDGSQRFQGFARVTNFGGELVHVPLRSMADGVPLESIAVRIGPRSSHDYVISLSPTVRLFEVILDAPDSLPLDNYAQAVVASEDLDVTVVSTSPPFVERGLGAIPNLRVSYIRPQQYRSEVVGAVTVFDGFLPRSRDVLPSGSILVMNPPVGTFAGFEIAEVTQPQQIVRFNARSDLLQSLDLAGVFLPRMVRVKPPAGTSPVVESRDQTLVWQGFDEGRKLIVLAFDPRQPEIGQRLAFPLLLSNALNWLAPNSGSQTMAPGQVYNIQPARTAVDVVVRDPTGKTYLFPVNAASRGRAIPFAETQTVGRYAIVQRSATATLSQIWFTVNAGDEVQSDIRPRQLPGATASQGALRLVDGVTWEFWPYLVVAALLLLVTEWFVYARR